MALIHCELSYPKISIFYCHLFQYFLLSLHNWANCSHVGEALISIEPPHLHPALGLSSQHPEQQVRQRGSRNENWLNGIKFHKIFITDVTNVEKYLSQFWHHIGQLRWVSVRLHEHAFVRAPLEVGWSDWRRIWPVEETNLWAVKLLTCSSWLSTYLLIENNLTCKLTSIVKRWV